MMSHDYSFIHKDPKYREFESLYRLVHRTAHYFRENVDVELGDDLLYTFYYLLDFSYKSDVECRDRVSLSLIPQHEEDLKKKYGYDALTRRLELYEHLDKKQYYSLIAHALTSSLLYAEIIRDKRGIDYTFMVLSEIFKILKDNRYSDEFKDVLLSTLENYVDMSIIAKFKETSRNQ